MVVPVLGDGDGGVVQLAVGGDRVDAELPALCGARGAVALGVNAVGVGTVLRVALPRHHEVTGGVHRDRGVALNVGGGRVHPQLGALFHARRVVALGEDAVLGDVGALPGDDKVTRGVH